MLPIPESITGKAESFFEFYKYAENGDIDEVEEFYSQSFEKEMAAKYFKGTSDEYVEMEFVTGDFEEEYLEVRNIEMVEVIILKTPLPATLDDFIRDCQRAGINLTWKEK